MLQPEMPNIQRVRVEELPASGNNIEVHEDPKPVELVEEDPVQEELEEPSEKDEEEPLIPQP